MMMMMVVGLYSCKIVLVLKGVSLTTDICLGDNLHTHNFLRSEWELGLEWILFKK